MKFTLVLLVALFGVISGQQTAIGRVVDAQQPVECTANDFGVKCNSCTTALICSGGVSLATVTCEAPFGYCDNRACTSTRPSTCASGSSAFKCPVVRI